MATHYFSRRLGRILTPDEARAAGLAELDQGTGWGLGDMVERVAKPIARWLDARHATDPALGLPVHWAVQARLVTLPLAGCSACSRRRRRLNAILPDLRFWRSLQPPCTPRS